MRGSGHFNLGYSECRFRNDRKQYPCAILRGIPIGNTFNTRLCDKFD